ncbi:hypothetical protein LCGC14_0658160 [marine sediment metagenome]|uniref:Uncharacterized protein n=1 Tax=marine sediment metagenome TaxID=412755 RepID=A0A0F9REA6_9ZZZZ
MRVTKTTKIVSVILAVVCLLGYLVTFAQQPTSDVLWGFAVFFACLTWFTEEDSGLSLKMVNMAVRQLEIEPGMESIGVPGLGRFRKNSAGEIVLDMEAS